MSFISLHTSHYSVQESWRMLNVKRGWKNNKNNKVFWFYVWVGKRVYKSKVKIYKNGKQIFSNIFSGLKTSSQSIRNYQPVSRRPGLLNLKRMDNFLLGQKHIYVRDKNVWHELIY